MFGYYCGKCHGEGSQHHLPLNDLGLLRKVRSDFGDSPQDLLRSGDMPRKAPGVPTLSDLERQQLILLLDSGA